MIFSKQWIEIHVYDTRLLGPIVIQSVAKVNVDGAFVPATGEAGTGIIVRNGLLWSFLLGIQSGTASPQKRQKLLRVEMESGWWQNGWNNQRFLKTDRANVACSIALNGNDRSRLWLVLREVRSAIPIVPSFRVEVICREANAVAHGLAQLGPRRTKQSMVWREQAPECVSELLARHSWSIKFSGYPQKKKKKKEKRVWQKNKHQSTLELKKSNFTITWPTGYCAYPIISTSQGGKNGSLYLYVNLSVWPN